MTTEQHRNNPLHGVGLKVMLEELVEQYGWEILSLQLKINSFEKFPSIKSAQKFLHKTQWAREKTEAFYLYKFKQLPIPSDEEHVLPPRERSFEADLEPQLPAILTESDREFFDDPVSGPKFRTPFDENLSKDKSSSRRSDSVEQSSASPWSKEQQHSSNDDSLVGNDDGFSGQEKVIVEPSAPQAKADEESKSSSDNADPWGKWRK